MLTTVDLISCLSDYKARISLNFLSLNENKTEAIMYGPLSVSGSTNQVLGSLASYLKPSIKNMGIVFDSGLKFDKQVNCTACQSLLEYKILRFVFKVLNGLAPSYRSELLSKQLDV